MPISVLDLLHHFIVFEVDGDKITKKMAGYHQFHAVNKAIDRTVTATNPESDRRVGVIWHTQGSDKSLTMAFYAGKIIQHPDLDDIQRAVEDEATVRIYYEGRLTKLNLEESERPKIDPNFEEVTEDEQQTTKEKLKSKWARLEALAIAFNPPCPF